MGCKYLGRESEKGIRVRMRNRRQNSFLCIMAMACAAAIIGCGTPSIKDGDTVMEIDGQPVVKAE